MLFLKFLPINMIKLDYIYQNERKESFLEDIIPYSVLVFSKADRKFKYYWYDNMLKYYLNMFWKQELFLQRSILLLILDGFYSGLDTVLCEYVY